MITWKPITGRRPASASPQGAHRHDDRAPGPRVLEHVGLAPEDVAEQFHGDHGTAAGPHLTEPSGIYDLGDLTPPATATVTFRSDGSAPVRIGKIWFETGTAFVVSGAPQLPATCRRARR